MKAKELAEKFLIKKTKIKHADKEREVILKNRMHIFEGMKIAFGIKDDDEITEQNFQEMMEAFLKSKSHEIPSLSKKLLKKKTILPQKQGGNK